MVPAVTWAKALAWRLRRHHLDPVGAPSAEAVVRDLCGIQAQVASSAEAAVRVRRATQDPGEIAGALAHGRLIKTWAMRGTLHLLTPADGPAFLSLMAAGRSWERPSWQRYFGMSPAEMQRLRDVVREALSGQTLTRDELVARVVARPGAGHLAEALGSGWGTLLKPIAWQGDLCHGPMRGRNVTFQRPADASPAWPGLPDPEVAAPLAIAAYLRAYGPAPIDAFGSWLSGGYFGKRQLRAWQAAMGDRISEVRVDGDPAFVLAEDVDGLLATAPSDAIRLLPGFDQWIMGPGSGALSVVPAARRAAVSRQSGWIASVVIRGGVVTGTWAMDGSTIRIDWFAEAGSAPDPHTGTIHAEAMRWAAITGRDLDVTIASV